MSRAIRRIRAARRIAVTVLHARDDIFVAAGAPTRFWTRTTDNIPARLITRRGWLQDHVHDPADRRIYRHLVSTIQGDTDR